MPLIATRDPRLTLRFATPDDAALVLAYMKKLGTYQKMADRIIATEAGLRTLLATQRGEAVLALYDGQPVGFIYFCQTSSAFIGQSGLYIDGFLVDDTVRFQGVGKVMMAFMARLALERGCQRLEWGCLDWNAPTIAFYTALGALPVQGMTLYRLGPEQLQANAERFEVGTF